MTRKNVQTQATVTVILPDGMTAEEADRLVREADEATYAAEVAAGTITQKEADATMKRLYSADRPAVVGLTADDAARMVREADEATYAAEVAAGTITQDEADATLARLHPKQEK